MTTSRSGRQAVLRRLINEGDYTSQTELTEALAAVGVVASQSTLSKDLHALGAVRRRREDGRLVYVLDRQDPAARVKLAQLCGELLQTQRIALNQLVLRTPPGAAQYFGSALDHAGLPGTLGTIAGDDTVLVITESEDAATRVGAMLETMTRTGRPMEDA
ncbi:arginine repressor [uncultured Tessaracoccus sp.]|uniref:arginine repressor n=1 Tax=uncultured Tessaracoccus sp. TaxID=905023 RepID=UPI0025D6F0CE|nr:arginine repressor [uncultured Tessaracoccus sp.]